METSNKVKDILQIVLKHWRTTLGAAIVIVSTFLLILKVISIEAYAAIISAMVTAGYLPKKKSDENE